MSLTSPEERAGLNAITEKIIGCAYKVANTLGCGFVERVHENALTFEISKCGLSVERQVELQVRYEKIIVGEYAADMLIERKVLVEIKAVKALDEAPMAQCMNYLRATRLKLCLLLNFGRPKIEAKLIAN